MTDSKKKTRKKVQWAQIPTKSAYWYEGEPWRKVSDNHGKCSVTGRIAKPLPGKSFEIEAVPDSE